MPPVPVRLAGEPARGLRTSAIVKQSPTASARVRSWADGLRAERRLRRLSKGRARIGDCLAIEVKFDLNASSHLLDSF